MSHIVQYKAAEFKRFDLLKEAFAALGWKHEQHTTLRTYGFSDQQRKFDDVFRNPCVDGYDVAVTKDHRSTEYILVGDLNMGGIHESLSGFGLADFGILRREYNAAYHTDLALNHNGTFGRQMLADGTLQCELEMEVEVDAV